MDIIQSRKCYTETNPSFVHTYKFLICIPKSCVLFSARDLLFQSKIDTDMVRVYGTLFRLLLQHTTITEALIVLH